jgi:hypothetical protein
MRWQEHGSDPYYRFSLANETTSWDNRWGSCRPWGTAVSRSRQTDSARSSLTCATDPGQAVVPGDRDSPTHHRRRDLGPGAAAPDQGSGCQEQRRAARGTAQGLDALADAGEPGPGRGRLRPFTHVHRPFRKLGGGCPGGGRRSIGAGLGGRSARSRTESAPSRFRACW